ncbi:ARM REPEAT PROTEIN INTERACTING WITH ABF2-like [Rosa rugosa]|uniref:ARM REPEAT PROTEIN INTERACTING WITH ABF2-like n=1 Tax=Rosa rugosa TaxID=74645 RepID=UPI002B40474E|nr:ARM REPEAT PROTEIN INTERACTING WITH ABF2-like [Rosa rugosa]
MTAMPAKTQHLCKKAQVIQRAAVQPLIKMLQSPDSQVREMLPFAIGRLAQLNLLYCTLRFAPQALHRFGTKHCIQW